MAGKDLSGLVATARRQGTGAAIAGLAQQLGADMSAASQLASVARAVEDNRERFVQAFGGATVAGSVYAASGSGRTVAGSFGANGSGLFGAGPAGVNKAFNDALAQFGVGESDIWHTGTDLNIFQIVSIGSALSPRLRSKWRACGR